MADEHFFDVVCEVDSQEVSNAVNQTIKEINQRFDLKGSKCSIDFDKDEGKLTLSADDEYHLKGITDILQTKLVKRNVPLKSLNYGKIEPAASNTVKQEVNLQQGIPTEKAKEMVKLIKDMKLKVTAEIRKDQVRVKGKKIDDLQTIMTALKAKDFDLGLQFKNYK
ncbi:MAG: YajQ family cyclic di-GMP-binding protein [Candidatus Magnetoovum sp. WYHC-5]|nr:YajQ family cyclic di-GMP-binding protein [Candidatus Magnetoovum sp. WYHC-5]